MQPASDMFLGWTKGVEGRHFYIRQLRDIRVTADSSVVYADQAEKDHAALERAVRSGKVEAEFEEEE